MENPIVKEDYDYNDYIKLGKYKGIEVKLEKLEVDEIDMTLQFSNILLTMTQSLLRLPTGGTVGRHR